MDNAVKCRLQSVVPGEAQIYRNIAIVPLIAPSDGSFQYHTLSEALAAWDVAITEVSASGSVPELLVVNRANTAVLLIDGEELAGAKQNRVLNTSILLKEVSETRIPVSCTEQGRWAYASKSFSTSGNVMAYKSRSKKTRSVHTALEACGAPMSDQGEVWDDIAELQHKAGTRSPTSAMNDVFKAREEDLRRCEATFRPVAGQVGFVSIINGAPAGLDLVSLTTAYAKLHAKLVRSYTLEALLDAKAAEAAPDNVATRAREFIDEICKAEACQFPSVGHGTDHRYRGKGLAGAALVHEKEVIHAAFFRLDDIESPDRMASHLHRRRRFVE